MEKMRFSKLFSPIQIGNITVKNRIFMPAMTTALCSPNNTVTDEALSYYEARFRGGVGLVTTETVMMDENSHYSTPNNMGLYRDDQIPGMRKLAELAHQYDTRIVAQLLHGGPAAVAALNNGRQPRAASAIPLRNVGEIPCEMSQEEIRELTARYADAAWRAKQAGLDGVEVHSCHRHGILGTFLSPLSNKRTDEYGGNIDGRMRFLLEVIDAIRQRCGRDFLIIVRMSMTEYEPGGQSFLDAVYIARTLQAAGVDMLNLSDSSLEMYWRTVTPGGTAKGVNSELSGKLRQYVDIPIGVVGRINEPWAAELVLDMERADVVYMGRALLCDPDFPNKAYAGQLETIRPCIGCTDCITHAHGPVIRCTMNPTAGREYEVAGKAAKQKRVLVVGGGAAGLSAAATLAARGHSVTLAEATDRLGGQMELAAFPIGKQDIAQGVKYLIGQAKSAGVDIRMKQIVTKEWVLQINPDAVVIATGGSPIVPKFLHGAKQIVNGWDVLAGKVATGKNIVVVGGGDVGCEVADFLIHPQDDLSPSGKRVTIIEMGDNLMPNDKAYARSLLVRRLKEKGCRILLSSKVERVCDTTVEYSQNGTMHMLENVDTIVAALGSTQDNEMAEECKALGIETVVVGAAVKTCHIYDAVMEGQLAAEAI